jgi:cysteinyl-tRNA synthetase
MPLTIYDTLRRETVPFETREPGRASIYVCGPTVYGEPHIGHGRFAVVFDVLNRYLRARDYDVTYVMNFTDVDDKIIARAHEEGTSPFEVADRYGRSWNRAMDGLGVLPPDIQPRATAHILEMQELISELLAAGKAYESEGNVLFRVRSFDGYGKLSGRRLEDAQQPADVASVVKEDPVDFAMWKAAKPGEPAWPSPWGPGRPGWHIECSAMSVAHLGSGFDLHCGGVDLIFPHHENEIAQHEAAHGAPFARQWMHNGMLQFSETKMSKSLGNVVDIEAAVRRWGRGPMRLWYASAAYRSPLTFDSALIGDATASYGRLVTFVRNARTVAGGAQPDADVRGRHEVAAHDALDDDLNLPGALAAIHDAVADGNERLGKAEGGDGGAQAAVAALADVVVGVGDDILGLGISETLARAERIAVRIRPIVDELLERRDQARAGRDFATADSIREQLAAARVVVEDRPAGVRWHLEPEFSESSSDDDGEVAAAPGQSSDGGPPESGLATAEI